jgi:hypothetical protein
LLAYRIDEATPGEVQADPFGGHGAFLAMAAPAAEILCALEAAAGRVIPAVAFDGTGAWVDASAPGTDLPRILARWEG